MYVNQKGFALRESEIQTILCEIDSNRLAKTVGIFLDVL